MGSFGTEPQQAIVSWFCLLIARSCVHVICVFWRWLKTWKLERSKSSARTKAPGNTASEVASHARQATGLAETAGAGRWVSSESVPTENPRRFHNLEQMAIFKKRSQGLTTCISALLLYQYRHCGRPQWKNEKYLIMTTRPEL